VRLRGVLPTAIAIASGLLVLAGYFLTHSESGGLSPLAEIQMTLLNWAVILAGFAILIGIVNLSMVHFKKIQDRKRGSVYSILLIFSLITTFVFGLLEPTRVKIVFTMIQLPVEASLMALLAITLTYASIRLLHRRFDLISVIFLITAVLVMLGTIPLPLLGNIPGISNWLRPVIARVVATSGARGILLGVALGTLTTGLRILFGTDRPYEGNK
jgi:hypothetical protein